ASPRSCAAASPAPRARPPSSSGASSTRTWRSRPPRSSGRTPRSRRAPSGRPTTGSGSSTNCSRAAAASAPERPRSSRTSWASACSACQRTDTMNELLYEVKDKIATITLNRPDKLNAFTRDMLDGWQASLAKAQGDDNVNVVIVTGAGRAFCSGGDVGRMREGEPSALDGKNGLWEGVHRVPKQLEQMDKP